MALPDTKLLAELIRGKRECLLQLRDLGRRQIELIDEGNMTALLEVLTAKQRPLEKLQQIERSLDAFRGQDPDQRRWQTNEERRLCTEQLQQCERLLAEIISQEKCSEGALLQRRDEAARRLQDAQFAGQAREAYTTQPDRQAKQIDLYCSN